MDTVLQSEIDGLASIGVLSPSAEAYLKDPVVAKLNIAECTALLWLSSQGEGGVARSRVDTQYAEPLLALECFGHVMWERDNRGRPSYLVLTWKGDDAVKVLRRASSAPPRWRAPKVPKGDSPVSPHDESTPPVEELFGHDAKKQHDAPLRIEDVFGPPTYKQTEAPLHLDDFFN